MSEPKRYTLEMVSSEAGHIHWMHDNEEGLSAPIGDFVRWEDYAALLATNERVCQRFAKTQCEANEAEAENARLKAENERLRKAGDGLEQAFREGWNMTQAMPEIDAWLTAKEGKQS